MQDIETLLQGLKRRVDGWLKLQVHGVVGGVVDERGRARDGGVEALLLANELRPGRSLQMVRFSVLLQGRYDVLFGSRQI